MGKATGFSHSMDEACSEPVAVRFGLSLGQHATLLLCGAGLLLAIFAAAEFRRLGEVTIVDIRLASTDALSVEEGVVCGKVRENLPKRRLHWDGQPARSCLVDLATGDVLAPPVSTANSLGMNPRGVLWTDGVCCYALDRATFESKKKTLGLRFEQLRSPFSFYGLGVLALATFLGGIVCLQVSRVRHAPVDRRAATIASELRVTTFVVLALFCGFAFYPGLPVGRMESDSANINAFAAGLNSPESFRNDPLLSVPGNFEWYTPLYVRMTQLFGWLGFHYNTSRAFLSLATALLGLFGYFRLYRILSGSAAFGFAAAVGLMFLKGKYPPNEIWIPTEVFPRTVYGALLPWAILVAMRYLPHPRLWAIPAAVSALLFYVHPVSSPALTGAVLMGFLVSSKRIRIDRISWSVLAGVAAVAVMFPYVWIYSGKYSGTVVTDPAVIEEAMVAARARFAPGYLDIGVFCRLVFEMFAVTPRYWVGAAALVWLVACRRQSRFVRVFCGMAAGFAIVTFLIPALDLFVADRLGRLPFQIDLIRNVRYLDVLLLALWGLALRESRSIWKGAEWGMSLQSTFPGRAIGGNVRLPARTAVALAAVVLAYGPWLVIESCKLFDLCRDNVLTLAGTPPAQIVSELEILNAIKALRRPDEVVCGPLNLRQAHIPLAHLTKDLGALAYANPQGLVRAQRALDESEPNLEWPITLSGVRTVAAILDADLFVLARESTSPELARSPAVLFQNASSLLVRIEPDARSYRNANLTRHDRLGPFPKESLQQ